MNTIATAVSSPYAALLPLLGRVLLASLFLGSACTKLAAPAGTIGYIAAMGLPQPPLAYAAALLAELGGGLLLLLGYRTRLVAAVLALFSLFTALVFHHALSQPNELYHFLKNLAVCGGLLQLVAFGAGAFSLDQRRAGR